MNRRSNAYFTAGDDRKAIALIREAASPLTPSEEQIKRNLVTLREAARRT